MNVLSIELRAADDAIDGVEQDPLRRSAGATARSLS